MHPRNTSTRIIIDKHCTDTPYKKGRGVIVFMVLWSVTATEKQDQHRQGVSFHRICFLHYLSSRRSQRSQTFLPKGKKPPSMLLTPALSPSPSPATPPSTSSTLIFQQKMCKRKRERELGWRDISCCSKPSTINGGVDMLFIKAAWVWHPFAKSWRALWQGLNGWDVYHPFRHLMQGPVGPQPPKWRLL